MRTQATDRMAAAMNRAFDKSGMTLKEFMEYIILTRKIFDYVFDDEDGYLSFHVVKEGQIYQFFFVFDTWYCKQ